MLKLIKTIDVQENPTDFYREKDLKKFEIFDGGINYLFVVKHYKNDRQEYIFVDLERKKSSEIKSDNYEIYLNLDIKSIKYDRVKVSFKYNKMKVEEMEQFIEVQKEVIKFVKDIENYLKERDMFCK